MYHVFGFNPFIMSSSIIFPYSLVNEIMKIKVLEETKTASKKEVGNLKRKLTNSKKKTKKMQEAYDNDDISSAEDFLKKFAKNK